MSDCFNRSLLCGIEEPLSLLYKVDPHVLLNFVTLQMIHVDNELRLRERLRVLVLDFPVKHIEVATIVSQQSYLSRVSTAVASLN